MALGWRFAPQEVIGMHTSFQRLVVTARDPPCRHGRCRAEKPQHVDLTHHYPYDPGVHDDTSLVSYLPVVLSPTSPQDDAICSRPDDSLLVIMTDKIATPVVDRTGTTRLRDSLERAKRGEGPSIGQWLEFHGYSLAKTVAPLGEDVGSASLGCWTTFTLANPHNAPT